jgi:hypothetical protein
MKMDNIDEEKLKTPTRNSPRNSVSRDSFYKKNENTEDIPPPLVRRNASFFKTLLKNRQSSGSSPLPTPPASPRAMSVVSEIKEKENDNFDSVSAVDEIYTPPSPSHKMSRKSEERLYYEKREYLLDLEKYKKLGFNVQTFTIDDSLIKIQYEWERQTLMIQSTERVETIKTWIRGSVFVVYFISRIFTDKLDGWVISVNNELENPRYIPAFEEIYREQFKRGPPNPKMQLLQMLLVSLGATVLANLISKDKPTIGNYGRHAQPQQQQQIDAPPPAAAAAASSTSQTDNGGFNLGSLFGGGGGGGMLSTVFKLLPQLMSGFMGGGGGGGAPLGGVAGIAKNLRPPIPPPQF